VIVRIHSRGSGGGSGPTGYLMGAKDHAGKVREVAPEVLRGNPEQTRELIDSLDFKRKYTSGVLSFSEANIKPEQKQKIMDSWEGALFPGMDKNQYSVLWVEHRDKGRLELNFVIPNVELQSGKRLQPYFDKADRNRVDAWQTLTNAAYGFTDPHDPERSMTLTPAQNLPKGRQEAAEAITNGLLTLGVENRAQVIAALSEAGLEVVRQTKSGISIKDPEGGQNLRLKGALYAENYRGGQELRAAREAAERGYREGRESRIREASSRFERGIELRRDFLAERYKPTQTQALDARSIERASIDRTRDVSSVGNQRDLGLVRVREQDAAPDHHRDSGRREQVGGLQKDLPRPERQDKPTADLLPFGVDDHEPDPVRANALRIAKSTRDRATERTQSNELHATGDRPASRIAQAVGELAARINQSFERARDFVREKLAEITKAEQKHDKGHGMSR
jgi:Relaxase/Mobilisation nuclease domain